MIMKVLQAYKDFSPLEGGGGIARHIHGLAEELTSAGLKVRVAAPAPTPMTKPYATVAASPTRILRHVLWADVVHIHGPRTVYSAWVGILALLCCKPLVYTAHCYYDDTPMSLKYAAKIVWDQTAERLLLHGSGATILLAEEWRTYLKKRRLPSSRCCVIPNCIRAADVEACAPEGTVASLSGSPAIFYVGRIDPVKRLDDAISALAEPCLSTAQLHIVGKGPDLERLKALASSLGVSNRVIFYGFVDDDEVARMVAGAQVFVLPSAREGLPTVLLEMLFRGLPVVCSRIPGNMAVMDTVKLDTTHPVGDVSLLAKLCCCVAGSRVPENVRNMILENFTWEVNAPKIAAIYRRLICQGEALHQ